MDGHQASMAMADSALAPGVEVISRSLLGIRPGDLDQRLRHRRSQRSQLICVYDAGSGVDWRDRSLLQPGDACRVVAPAVIAHKAGDRLNTDSRDAMLLACLQRSGAHTPVAVRTVAPAVIRDLRRAREDTHRDLPAATWRLTAFVRRHASRDMGRAHGSPAPGVGAAR
jgi:hypothetical protein